MHRILDTNILSSQEITDCISSFYKGTGVLNVFEGMKEGFPIDKTLGLHTYEKLFNEHEIYLNTETIRKAFHRGLRCGGNKKVSNLKVACGMVLAHEIKHANQAFLHEHTSTSFYGSKRSRYVTRPAEMEARAFADDNIDIIAAIVNVRLRSDDVEQRMSSDEALVHVENNLLSLTEVYVDDIKDELREVGMYNFVYFERMKNFLREKDVQLKSGAAP